MQKKSSVISSILPGVTMVLLTTSSLAQSVCPERFHNIPLLEDAMFCQQFDDKLPASVSFYSPIPPDAVVNYYTTQLKSAQQHQRKGRQILQSPKGNWVVVISTDGNGSQIDILVKADEQ